MLPDTQCPCGKDTAGQHHWDCPSHPRYTQSTATQLDPHFHPAQVNVNVKIEPCENCEALRKERDDILEELMDTVNQSTRQGGKDNYVLDPMGLSAYEDALDLLHRLGKVESIPPCNYTYRWKE